MEEKVILKRPPKSPALAGILSFFFPTTGTLYNAQYLKFFIFLIIFAGLITMQTSGEGQPFAALLLAGFYGFQIFEAMHTSRAINRRALKGEEEEEEDELEELPQVLKTGSIFWGIVLMALGGILLLANFDVINYDSVFDFWPVVVIVIGLKLVADYVLREKKES